MDSYSNKINRIKYTIDEIREDIEQMKLKNEKTINTMMTSITPPQDESTIKTDRIPISLPTHTQHSLNEEDKEELIQKYKYDYCAQPKSTIQRGIDCHREVMLNSNHNNSNSNSNNSNRNINANNNIKQSESNYTYECNNSASNYENEIGNLRAMVLELQTKNDNLTKDLLEEQKRNQVLLQRNNEGNKELLMIQNQLGVSCVDNVLPKLEELLRDNNENKLRDELIEKMTALYVSLTGANESEPIDIKTIWRWIKHLINTVKELANEKEKGKQAYYQSQETNIYKEYCMELMQEFNLKNLEDLELFVNDLLARNNINKKRVEKIKRVLSDPQYHGNLNSNSNINSNNTYNMNNIGNQGIERDQGNQYEYYQ